MVSNFGKYVRSRLIPSRNRNANPGGGIQSIAPARRGFGIAARLGASFAIVASLAIVANIVAEYGTSIVTTTLVRSSALTRSITPNATPADARHSVAAASAIAPEDLASAALHEYFEAV